MSVFICVCGCVDVRKMVHMQLWCKIAHVCAFMYAYVCVYEYARACVCRFACVCMSLRVCACAWPCKQVGGGGGGCICELYKMCE